MPAKKTAKKTVKKATKKVVKKSADVITKQSNIELTLTKHPEVIPVLYQFGFGCIGCVAAHFETIEEGAAAHGIDADELVKAMNKAMKK